MNVWESWSVNNTQNSLVHFNEASYMYISTAIIFHDDGAGDTLYINVDRLI